MDAWRLPTKLNIGGKDWDIRTDFRVVLDVISALTDPDLENDEKWLACLMIMFVDFDKLPPSDYGEACEQVKTFIDMGADKKDENGPVHPRVMDWEHDAQMIIPAVNRVMNKEIRAEAYMHWWTFLSAYMEIGECTYSHVLNIRTKKAKGKKLEKWEQEFLRNNKDLITLETKKSQDEIEEEKLIKELLGV